MDFIDQLKASALVTRAFLMSAVLSSSVLASTRAHAQRRRPSGRVAMIRGELSYASEAIPPELIVCAEDLKTGNVMCRRTNDKDRDYDLTYELTVPPGSYFIYATLPYDAEDNLGR